jgi:hypothetical protein
MVRSSRPLRTASNARLLLIPVLVAVLIATLGSVGAAPAHRLAPPQAGRAGTVPSAGPAPAASAVTVSIAGATPSAVSLSWTETTDLFFTQYTVLESDNGTAGPWQSVAVITTQATTQIVVPGLSPGGTYGWEIEETGFLSSTADSNAVVGTQPTLSFLTYHVLSSTSIELNWTNNASYGGLLTFGQYQVWATTAGATTSQAIETSVAENSTVVTGLGPGSDVLYYVNTTDCASGCSGAGGTDLVTESNAVTYGAPLTLGATLVADRVVVDANQSDLFTCTPSGGESPFNFTWQIGSGAYAAAPSSTSFTFATAGPTSVTCWVQDSLGTHVTTSTTVQVNAAPSASGSANRSAVDVGQSLALSCSATLGTAPYTFTWATGSGQLLSGADLPVSYSSPGSVVATCFAVDSTGTTATSAVDLVVSPDPGARATDSTTAAAPGANITFTASGTNGSGGFGGFSWNFGDGTLGAGASVIHTFSTAANYTVTVTLNDSNGVRATAVVSVAVSPIHAALTMVPSDVATGGWWNVTASASGGAGAPYTYLWNFGDGTNSSGASATHQYSVPGTFPVQLTVKDRLGSTLSVSVTTVSVVTPPPPPPPSPLPLELGILGLIALVIIVLLAVLLVTRRRRRDKAYPAVAGRVPTTDPATSVQGTKVCPRCGSANVATRKTCSACGAALGRSVLK